MTIHCSYLRNATASTGVSQSIRLCIRFCAISRAMTRPFTCRAIAWPFTRLAIAHFYVYDPLINYTGSQSNRELITKSSCLFIRLFTTKLHLTSRTWSKLMLSEDVLDLAAQHYSLSQELTVWLLETVYFQVRLLKFGINYRRISKTVSLKH